MFRKLRIKGIQPTIQTYNLLLRAVRDCGAGESPNAGQELLESLTRREATIPKRLVKTRAKALTSGAKALPSSTEMQTLTPLESKPAELDDSSVDVDEDVSRNANTDALERHAKALMVSFAAGDVRNPEVPFDMLGKSLVTVDSLHDVVGISRLDKAEDR